MGMRAITLPRLTILRQQIKRTFWIREIIACNLPLMALSVITGCLGRPYQWQGRGACWNEMSIILALMSKLARVAHCQSESVLTCRPPNRWVKAPLRGQKDERGGQKSERGKREEERGQKNYMWPHEADSLWDVQLPSSTRQADLCGKKAGDSNFSLFSLFCFFVVFCQPGIHCSVTDVKDMEKAWRVLPQYLIRISLFALVIEHFFKDLF